MSSLSGIAFNVATSNDPTRAMATTETAVPASETTPEVPQTTNEESASDVKTEAAAKPSAIDTFVERLPAVLQEADYSECWGVSLQAEKSHGPTRMVLHKWLNSASGDLDLAVKNLTESLKWRKEFKPLECIDEAHDPKFNGLGYVTKNQINGKEAVFTWSVSPGFHPQLRRQYSYHSNYRNIYAAAKSHAEVFGDLQA